MRFTSLLVDTLCSIFVRRLFVNADGDFTYLLCRTLGVARWLYSINYVELDIHMRFVRVLFVCVLGTIALPATTASATSCRNGGPCAIGDVGPGGGLVTHVSRAPQWWGSYIESRPVVAGRGLPWSLQPTISLYTDDASGTAIRKRIDARAMGMGAVNTQTIIQQSGSGEYAAAYVDALQLGSRSDWHLPSRDELDAAYHLVAEGKWPTIIRGPYWTSSENAPGFAWYQMFQDGTQFTDQSGVGRVNGIPIKSNKDSIRNSKHGMSGFPSLPYRIMATRAFGERVGTMPAVSRPMATGVTCTQSGPCNIGDTGPGGGIVFYDAGSRQPWGRYLEAAPSSTEVVGMTWKKMTVTDRRRPLYRDSNGVSARLQRVKSKLIGMGQINTSAVVKNYGSGNYAARYADKLVVNGRDDWFLPSEDELQQMYEVMQTADVPIDPLKKSFYWSSSEYDYDNAWTVNFKDGQQFDRMKWTIAGSGMKPIRLRAVRAFG